MANNNTEDILNPYWIRQQEANILAYLPRFLQTDKTIQALCNAHSSEHEKIRLIILDLLKQMFVSTATWGLDLWEKDLYITDTLETDTLEQRRNRIWLKLQTNNTSTLDFMLNLVNRYIKNKAATIEEISKDYAIKIYVNDGMVTSWADLLEAVETWIPAHLQYIFNAITSIFGGFWCGGLISTSSKCYIEADTTERE